MRRLLAPLLGCVLALIGLAHAQTLFNGQAPVTVMAPQPPFTRSGLTFAIPVSTQPQTYAIEQPVESMSYRGFNECFVDLVVTSVTVTQPVTTEPVVVNGETIPNVRRVTSATDSVNRFTGTFIAARTGRNFGSSQNPVPGSIRYVSTMALTQPQAWCAYRMLYGRGN